MLLDIKQDLLNAINEYYDFFIQWAPKLLLGLVILILGWLVSLQLGKFALGRLNQRLEDPLLAKFLARITKWIFLVLTFITALRAIDLGDVAGGLLAGAGVSAFIFGFAFKDIGENFLAGILLAFQRPFNVGDTIESGDIKGNVLSLDLRNTQVKTFDGKDVFIPNSHLIKNPLINYTIDGFLRQDFVIGVDYGADINTALNIVLGTISEIPGVLTEEKQPMVHITNLGSSSLALQVFYWLDTFDPEVSGLQVKTEAINKVLDALEGKGIYMPGDILELKNYHGKKLEIQDDGVS